MAPLVMLVGRNNTGKSYVASVAWAMANLHAFFSEELSSKLRPKWFGRFCRGLVKENAGEFIIDAKKAQDVIDSVNAHFTISSDEFLNELFAVEGFSGANLSLIAADGFVPFGVSASWAEGPDGVRRFISLRFTSEQELEASRIRIPLGPPRSTEKRLADRIFTEIVYRVLYGQPGDRRLSATYIPAARTGLMLAFQALVARLFDREPGGPVLPRPLTDFLQRLAYFNQRTARSTRGTELARWIGNEILRGDIEVSGEEATAIKYKPNNSDIALPLHAASSMVTELAPFLMLSRQDFLTGQIIFEEPEAHLHLSAQRSMARALARLLNSGAKILITTHSDTFVQQINNLMNLHSHPDRSALMEKLGYQASDLIDPAHTRAYEFMPDGDSTSIAPLVRLEGGYAVPSLNETLIDLANETVTISESADD
jgi:hypothetical protein